MAMYKLNDCFNDKFSFYIYFQDELNTLDDWIRETDPVSYTHLDVDKRQEEHR